MGELLLIHFEGTSLMEMSDVIPLVLALITAVVNRINGNNALRFNTGLNGDSNSVRIATRHPSFNESRDVWKKYACIHTPYPVS